MRNETENRKSTHETMGRDSAVSITIRYGLYGLGIESRRGEIFLTRPHRPWVQPSLPVQWVSGLFTGG
jgi:hypothetical protein